MLYCMGVYGIMSNNMTPTERVKKHRDARGTRRVPIDGDILERLDNFQKTHGIQTRREALDRLLKFADS
jgi:hypothetical protein